MSNAAVQETPAADQIADQPATEITEDDALSAAWDKLHAEGGEEGDPDEDAVSASEGGEDTPSGEDGGEDGEDGEGGSEDGSEVEEGDPDDKGDPDEGDQPAEAPSELPQAVRDAWKDIPEGARDAVLSAHREMGRKLAEQGRLVSAVKPVQEVLAKALNELPELAAKTPQEAAQVTFGMAKLAASMKQNPVATVMGAVQHYGIADQVRQALGLQPQGRQPSQGEFALRQEIASLKQQLQRAADPELIERKITETMTVREAQRAVDEFAAGKEFWNEIEPNFAQFAKLAREKKPNASLKDVLETAYDMAVNADPEIRAKVKASAEKARARQPDPKKTERQNKAKNANLPSGRPGRKSAPRSEDEALAEAYDRIMNA